MKELAAAGVLWFGRRGSGRMGETARAKQREPPWARAWRENAGDGAWEGRGWEKGKGHPLSFTHSTLTASQLGPESWAKEAWGASRGPLCPRKALKWGRSWRAWRLPQVPQGGKEGG